MEQKHIVKMITTAYPKMTQAQAMIGLYRSMSKKAKEEFKNWFFENEHESLVMTPELAASIEEGRKQIREGQCTLCRTKEELENFFDSL